MTGDSGQGRKSVTFNRNRRSRSVGRPVTFKRNRRSTWFGIRTDAAWNHDKPYENVAGHLSAVAARIVDTSSDVDDKLLAAIMSIWADKVALRPKPLRSPVEHLAGALIRAVVRITSVPEGSRKLWNAFRLAVERLYEPQMDEAKERMAIEIVGGLVAAAPNENESLLPRAEEALIRLRAGFVAGTAEEQYLLEGYANARATAAKAKS